jgi:Uncharacterized protein conserved in bacteria (DUF2252)
VKTARLNIVEATTVYERSAGAFTPLDRDELAYKHDQMADADDPFPFFRATYYRWAATFPQVLPDEHAAPAVPSVGDLHVENFGTWRDADSRPVFGVNDLDEADVLPYTNDLVRLAASFRLALAGPAVTVRVKPRELAAAMVDGYRQNLSDKGRPMILSEDQGALLGKLLGSLSEQPGQFWRKLDKHVSPNTTDVPADVSDAIAATAPPGLKFTFRHRRRVGLGSLGRTRFLGTAQMAGARLLREAKARVPPPTMLMRSERQSLSRSRALVQQILVSRTRAADPSLKVLDGWVIRRLAPDVLKLDLAALQSVSDWFQLAGAMGREAANIHLSGRGGDAHGRTVLGDLRRRPGTWLNDAAKQMVGTATEDWRTWCDYWRERKKA